MRNQTTRYSEGSDQFDVYAAYPADDPAADPAADPESARPHAAVIVCHAWGGRDSFAEDRANRLAELGYVGAAIDLYGIGQRGTDNESSSALMSRLVNDPALFGRRLTAAFDAVGSLEGVDPTRLGAIGFCFGGLCAIRMARMGLDLRGVVSFHGLLKIGAPLDAAIKAKLLILHGQDDPMVPPADVGAFAAEMKRIDADWQLHAYPGVIHGFTNPRANDPGFGVLYDEDVDRRSWQEMARFLAETLPV